MDFLIMDVNGYIIGYAHVKTIEELKDVWKHYGEFHLIVDFEEKRITIYSDWIE